jgi:acetyl-CoA carboxylase biotin carboxyl carrier protein
MDIEEIKTLTDLMIDNDLTEIRIRDGEKRILLRRGASAVSQQVVSVPAAPMPLAGAGATPGPASAATAKPAAPEETPDSDASLTKISSPMVGTFYATPDPDSPPFVKVGDEINPDTVVCIIEAMKVFNEIKAEVSGVIESIEVESGKPVEFGQTIMTVRVA